jgi:hypothetical protein
LGIFIRRRFRLAVASSLMKMVNGWVIRLAWLDRKVRKEIRALWVR